jgi:hypothetical protein
VIARTDRALDERSARVRRARTPKNLSMTRTFFRDRGDAFRADDDDVARVRNDEGDTPSRDRSRTDVDAVRDARVNAHDVPPRP